MTLTYRYSILYKVAIQNWVLSTHKSQINKKLVVILYQIGIKGRLNYSLHVFNYVIDDAESHVVLKLIGFLSLVFGIIKSQHNVVRPNDVFEP